MAERTHTFASFEDGRCVISYVYDDVSGKPLRIVAVNTHPTKTLYAGIERLTTGWSRSGSWGPNSGTTTVNIPPGQQQQFALIPDGGSEVDPYPTLGDLQAWAYVSG